MPEGVRAYPRWEGPMRTGTSLGVVAAQEVRRAFNNIWSRLVLTFVLAYAIVFIGNLYSLRAQATRYHTMDNYIEFVNNLRWAALAVAAVMAGPSLLEDQRRGALEMYLARAVTQADYLIGKILAVFGIATLSVWVPALLYYLMSFFIFQRHPAGWHAAPWGALLYALMWGLLVSGLGLGISCVARSSRGATLFLLGGFAILDVFLRRLLSGITKNQAVEILSPFAALEQQTGWIFSVPDPFQFPAWWGLLEWFALVAIGWGLVAWRHPRVRGEDRVSA